MPTLEWACGTTPKKKRIGEYYSTPIFSFRCKCHLCAGWFEIQTDPKNTRYVVTEGAKQQAQDWDPEEDGGHPVSYTKEGEDPNAGDAFAKFEKASTSKARALTAAERLDEIEQYNEDRWSDPYELNRNLRKALREDKGKRKEKRGRDDEILDRYGLGEQVRMDLVRADEDRKEGERADWLSRADKKEVLLESADEVEWAAAQLKRRKLLSEEEDRKKALTAETGWNAGRPVQSNKSPHAKFTVPARSSAMRGGRPSQTSSPSMAVSRLAGQLRLNSARKVDPFLNPSTSSSSISSSLGGSLIRNDTKRK